MKESGRRKSKKRGRERKRERERERERERDKYTRGLGESIRLPLLERSMMIVMFLFRKRVRNSDQHFRVITVISRI